MENETMFNDIVNKLMAETGEAEKQAVLTKLRALLSPDNVSALARLNIKEDDVKAALKILG